MASKNHNGSNALIDWVRSNAEGPLIGAVFSTYGLSLDQPDFFGQDFLPTLLGLGGVRDRGYASPVTMDRTLATSDVTLICDAHALASGARPTLRVDVLPIGHKLHHAKVILIHRQNRIRLIVGSANLTHEGFRRQREMAVVLDFHEQGKLPPEVLVTAVARWRAVLGDSADSQVQRVLDGVTQKALQWPVAAAAGGDLLPQVVFGGGPVPLWRQLVDAWPDGEPVLRWYICSPFWPQVQESAGNNPFEKIAGALQSKHAPLADCQLEVIARAESSNDTALPRFPFALVKHLRDNGFPVQRGRIRPARLDAADEEIPDGKAAESRDLHAKWVVLAGPNTVLAMVGSANFTRQGLGTLRDPTDANIEACVLLRWPRGKWNLETWLPPIRGQSVDWATCAVGDLREASEEETQLPDWPVFVQRIELVIHWEHLPEPDGELLLHLRPSVPPAFRVAFPAGPEDTADAAVVLSTPESHVRIPLTAARVRHVLARRVVQIVWEDGARAALFPVNVAHESKAAMPSVLGARPSEEQLLAYFHGRISEEDLLTRLEQQAREGSPPTASTVPSDSERLRLLQNYIVREFVEGLYGLTRAVQEAAFSPRAAEQALLGDLSPVSLAEQVVQALCAGRRSATAAAFQLAELIRVVGELPWSAPVEQSKDVWAAFELVRHRALERLFTIVKQAATRPAFGVAISDRDFAAYVHALLPADLAARWMSLAAEEGSAGAAATGGVNV